MGLKRRAFLKRSVTVLSAWGLSEVALSLATARFQQALAAPARRRLALLIGINQYPESVCDCTPSQGSALRGCLTDVELQRELLIGRFGFEPADIVTLTDQDATREAIAQTFLTHLTQQARSGDVVIVHFSGLGGQIRLPDGTLRNSLVPVDGVLPRDEGAATQDLTEETLGLLLRSLQTDRVITVLDTSYADTTQLSVGNLRSRARLTVPTGAISPAELALQDQLLGQLKTSRSSPSGQMPGVVLAASQMGQGALEGHWSGFCAGLFTYGLTQELWSATATTPLHINLGRVSKTLSQSTGVTQQPQLSGQGSKGTPRFAQLVQSVLGQNALGCDGAIRSVSADGETVQVWLGGIPASAIEYLIPGSLLSVDTGESHTLLTVRSRDGLSARARLCCGSLPTALQPGQWVREAVRVIPRNVGLAIALDAGLERIERVDATSAFSTISRVSSVGAGEVADYWFGKAQGVPTQTATLPPDIAPTMPTTPSPLPVANGGYGLFNLGHAAVPNTLVSTDEAVRTAVNRLAPHLHTLLAFKLLRLTLNREASQLGVRATLETIAPQEQIIAQQDTLRAASELKQSEPVDGLPALPISSQIRYRLENRSDRPLYIALLGLESNGSAIALYPPSSIEASQASPIQAILPNESLILPQTPGASDWTVKAPLGLVETYIVFSRAPLTQFYSAIETGSRLVNKRYRLSTLANPLDAVQALLQDLHQASTETTPIEIPTDAFGLDVTAWATLNFVYRSIDV